MPDWVLYHYPLSPFAEKMRAMLAHAGLEWHSVTVPEMPPRPILESLTGGYRRIPVAQCGADIFCDTRIISSEIADLSQKPLLSLDNLDPEQQAFVRETDLDIFLACILSANGKRLLRRMLRDASLWHVVKLMTDRVRMASKASVSAAGPAQAKRKALDHVSQLESWLEEHDFLFGDIPTNADFAAYHGLWFIRDASESSLLRDYQRVNQWMDRIQAFGEPALKPLDTMDAFQMATDHEPRPLPEQQEADDLLGKQVTVTPNDYGQAPVTGLLMASTPQRWIVRRDNSDHRKHACGRVHVHFPRQGFALTVC